MLHILCEGNQSFIGTFPLKGRWCGASMLPLMLTSINVWTNSRAAGDLRLWRTCTVMSYLSIADTIFEITLPPSPYHHSCKTCSHYSDVIMGAMVSQSPASRLFHSTVYSGADQRIHQSSPSLAFVRGIHRWPVNSPNKWPVTRKMFPFDDIFMYCTQPL